MTNFSKREQEILRRIASLERKAIMPIQRTVDFSQLSAAATTGNRKIYTLEHDYKLWGVFTHATTAFAGTGVTAVTGEIGTLAETDRYNDSISLMQIALHADMEYSLTESMTADTDIYITANSTGANLDKLTAGTVEILIYVSLLKFKT